MSGGSTPDTSTQTTEPPEFVQPYLDPFMSTAFNQSFRRTGSEPTRTWVPTPNAPGAGIPPGSPAGPATGAPNYANMSQFELSQLAGIRHPQGGDKSPLQPNLAGGITEGTPAGAYQGGGGPGGYWQETPGSGGYEAIPWEYGPNRVAGFSGETDQALQGMTDYANAGPAGADMAALGKRFMGDNRLGDFQAMSTIRGQAGDRQAGDRQAQNALRDTVGGKYLYGGEGMDAYMDAAARYAKPALNSQWAMSGRSNSGLGEAAKAQAMADSYAMQYGDERDRMMAGSGLLNNQYNTLQNRNLQAAGMLNNQFRNTQQMQLAGANLMPQAQNMDMRQMGLGLAAGQERDALASAQANEAADRFAYEQAAPYESMQRFASFLYPSSSIGGSQEVQTPGTTTGTRALGGALAGGGVGSAFGPYGAAIGAGAGGLLGLLS